MDGYTISQWLLFFFVYCLIGWIWETCFTSIKQRKFVNRGFLYGPILPIYGFGAIIILLLTLPVKENFLLIFLFGMIGATALEFVTGAAMERIFHMRYWDYSKQPLNVNGYICFKCSLGWGFFSIILVKG
ncbi:MAG: putative ABC transporter permease, partial [Oscillospiraceae bacterium]